MGSSLVKSKRWFSETYTETKLKVDLLIGTRFIRVPYRKGACATVALAIAFGTTFKEIYQLFSVLMSAPLRGCTTAEFVEALRYCEAIYERKTIKIHWRGKLYRFQEQYNEGLFIVNCEGHVGVIFNGIAFANKDKNYNVYNVWQVIL